MSQEIENCTVFGVWSITESQKSMHETLGEGDPKFKQDLDSFFKMDINDYKHSAWCINDGGLRPKLKGLTGTNGTFGCDFCTCHMKYKGVSRERAGHISVSDLGVERTMDETIALCQLVQEYSKTTWPDIDKYWHTHTHLHEHPQDKKLTDFARENTFGVRCMPVLSLPFKYQPADTLHLQINTGNNGPLLLLKDIDGMNPDFANKRLVDVYSNHGQLRNLNVAGKCAKEYSVDSVDGNGLATFMEKYDRILDELFGVKPMRPLRNLTKAQRNRLSKI